VIETGRRQATDRRHNMQSKITSRPVALVISLIFILASLVMVWKIIENGPTTERMIPAIGFTIAGVIWLVILFRNREPE
jgi:hypothetical protein